MQERTGKPHVFEPVKYNGKWYVRHIKPNGDAVASDQGYDDLLDAFRHAHSQRGTYGYAEALVGKVVTQEEAIEIGGCRITARKHTEYQPERIATGFRHSVVDGLKHSFVCTLESSDDIDWVNCTGSVFMYFGHMRQRINDGANPILAFAEFVQDCNQDFEREMR